MHNFQNDLQNLEMDSYQVGELTPISYKTIRACLVVLVCGGIGGSEVWRLPSLWRF